ncbi:MAG TPA: crossover junction endodeoxyribonuclease RuvC [Fimbriimonadaceae bacterium]|nr:crossover junction endodeoxyribonuclease RuvC [Fimbriimonadaceae bacterium]
MTVLGIDPGLERVGWAVVEKSGSALRAVEYGLIKTPRTALQERLNQIHADVGDLIQRFSPDCLATERLFFTKNQTTAMDVAKALGVVLLTASQNDLPCYEYSPPEVKLSVVGNGSAEKKQVQYMVVRLLSLKEDPKPDDVADALAVAVTHALRVSTASPEPAPSPR